MHCLRPFFLKVVVSETAIRVSSEDLNPISSPHKGEKDSSVPSFHIIPGIPARILFLGNVNMSNQQTHTHDGNVVRCSYRNSINVLSSLLFSGSFLFLLLLAVGSAHSDEDSLPQTDLSPLVQLLGEIDSPDFHLDVLKGMREGLKGRKSMPMPTGWKETYPKLARSVSAEVRKEAMFLGVIFNDNSVVESLRKSLRDAKSPVPVRKLALEALLMKTDPDLPQDLKLLLHDDQFCADALKGLAAYNHKETPKWILARYSTYSDSEKQFAISTLASRPQYALEFLTAMELKKVPRRDLSAFSARQLEALGDQQVSRRLKEVWGELRATSKVKQQLIIKYKQMLKPELMKRANLSNGRHLFAKTCMKCHRLFNEGGTVGPEITGSNRANLDYLLENILDPSAVIGRDYRMVTIATVTGRVLTGIVVEKSSRSVTIQTENEKVVLAKSEIDLETVNPISMMPEGQLEKLSEQEIRDLIAYLQSPGQVPLPEGVSLPK